MANHCALHPNQTKLLIILFPILFALVVSFIDVPGWEIWEGQKVPLIMSEALGYLLIPFSLVGFWLFGIMVPLLIALDAIPIIGSFLSEQFNYLLFSIFLALRYFTNTPQKTWKASLIGTLSIYLVSLLVMFSVNNSTDGQTGIDIAAGFGAAFLLAVIITEIVNFFQPHSISLPPKQ